jgi:hypothetical protein
MLVGKPLGDPDSPFLALLNNRAKDGLQFALVVAAYAMFLHLAERFVRLGGGHRR